MGNKKCNVNNCKKPIMKGIKYCYIHKNRQKIYYNYYIDYNYKESKIYNKNYINEFYNGCQDDNCYFCKNM